MREFKFRAWSGKINTMSPPTDFLELMTRPNRIKPEEVSSVFDHLIWMQYTGLKDRNGKEIYEGDVLVSDEIIGGDEDNPIYCTVGVVSWWEESARFFLVDEEGNMAEWDYADDPMEWLDQGYTVEGNIYENPEMLEKDDSLYD